MPDAVDLHIGERIRDAREYLELSIEETAEMLAVDAGVVGSIEAGDVPVTANLLADIARVLGRSLDYFTGKVLPATVDERTAFLARAAETLSDSDMGELQRFATYLRTRSEGATA